MRRGFDYEPVAQESLGRLAEARGVSAWDLAYDALLEDGRSMLYLPITNYSAGSLDAALEMMRHPHTVIALGDGGAHYGLICDAAYPSFVLSHWARDRHGERVAVEEMIKALTSETAAAVGFLDRGLLRPGYLSDLNVIDLDRIRLCRPEVRYDLPAGGRRMVQAADGYIATTKSGVVTYRNGEHTGALPGRLIRGVPAQPVPAYALTDAIQELS
jgi:N-acyl-D-aspartate/D-glutamate deacylase